MIKALLLDLDNTLVDRDAAFVAWLASRVSSSSGVDIGAIVDLDRGGYGDKRMLFASVGSALGISPSRARAAHDSEMPQLVKSADDAGELLHRFRGRKIVVTNGASAVQREKIRAAGLDGRFDGVVVSSEHGHDKPHPSIFRRALSLADAQPNEALMIGDHPQADVLGALAVGIRAIMLRTRWFDVPPGVHAITRLREVSW